MLTPTDERNVLDSLPLKFERHEILEMAAALQADLAEDEPGLSTKAKVHRHGRTHQRLLVALPFLFRSIVNGTYRPEVVNAILDARDQMEAGVDKKQALDGVIRRAVDEVNAIRAQSGPPTTRAAPEGSARSADTETS